MVGKPRGLPQQFGTLKAFLRWEGWFGAPTSLESLGTFLPGSCCPMSHPEDLVFPRVSAQDIFFQPLLIFHDLTLDSFKDQQRLLPARVFPTTGLRKSPVQNPVLSIPSGNHPLWQGGKTGLLGGEKHGFFGWKTGLFGRKQPGTWQRLGRVAGGL